MKIGMTYETVTFITMIELFIKYVDLNKNLSLIMLDPINTIVSLSLFT